MRLFSLLALSLLACPIFAAQPAVGTKAPDFQLSTVEGKAVNLSALMGRGPVVVVVLRGYPGYQCPFCNRQVQDFLQVAHDFEARGSHVIMVYPGPREEAGRRGKEFLEGKQIPANFDLVLDPGYEFTNTWGLRWDAPRETAYPSTFVLDATGVVMFSKVVKSHGGRTMAKEILDVLPKPKPKR